MRDNRPAHWRRWMAGALRGGGDPPLIVSTRRVLRADRCYTAHLGFTAADLAVARETAVGYAEALSVLRAELALEASSVSPAGDWRKAERLFCGAVGPDGECCVDVAGHPGFHHAPGPGGLGWGDGDVL